MAVMTSLVIHPISFGKTFHAVVFQAESSAAFALPSFLIHLPMNGILILSMISFSGSHGLHQAVFQLSSGGVLVQSLLSGGVSFFGNGCTVIGSLGAHWACEKAILNEKNQ